jgi:hypothetical protein
MNSDTSRLTKSDIVGARIFDIHADGDAADGLDCAMIYFTVDRGFSFLLPTPGYPWNRSSIPAGAERLLDEYVIPETKVLDPTYPTQRFVLVSSTTVDDRVRRIKERTILGVYCRKLVGPNDFYEPDECFLVFDDGTRAYCVTVAPHGTGSAGLHYRSDLCQLPKVTEFVDFFAVPLEQA